jgi:hypothetical protein
VYQWESGRLADEGEKIQLVNKYGKVIDQVIYNNKAPWPVPQNAQQGITLTSFDVDNHFGENWKASTLNMIVNIKDALAGYTDLRIYPNPTSGIVNISGLEMKETLLNVYNLTGILVKSEMVNSTHSQINLESLNQGIYIVRCGNVSQQLVLLK